MAHTVQALSSIPFSRHGIYSPDHLLGKGYLLPKNGGNTMECTERALWDSTGFFTRHLEVKSKVGKGKGFCDLVGNKYGN